MYFHYFVIISPWKKEGPSFEQTWIPFTQGYFVPSLVKIGPVVLEKKIFKSCQFIFINSQLSPLGKGRGSLFEQTWIPYTQGCFRPSLVGIGSVVLEKKMKMWKSLRQRQRRQQRRRTTDKFCAFSSGELKRGNKSLNKRR